MKITERQRTLIEFLAVGMTDKQIAVELEIHPGTVRRAIYELMKGVSAVNRSNLVAMAIREGHIL